MEGWKDSVHRPPKKSREHLFMAQVLLERVCSGRVSFLAALRCGCRHAFPVTHLSGLQSCGPGFALLDCVKSATLYVI